MFFFFIHMSAFYYKGTESAGAGHTFPHIKCYSKVSEISLKIEMSNEQWATDEMK